MAAWCRAAPAFVLLLVAIVAVPAAAVHYTLTIAGVDQAGTADGPPPLARFNRAQSRPIAVHPTSGEIYTCDYTDRATLRIITPSSDYAVSTHPATLELSSPTGVHMGVVFNQAGTALYFLRGFGGGQHAVYHMQLTDTAETKFCFTGAAGYLEGACATAKINDPRGITVDASDNLFIVDTLSFRVRKVTTATAVASNYAGTGTQSQVDGGSATATFNSPYDLAFATNGNLLVLDFCCIRVVTPDGTTTTLAGVGGSCGSVVDGVGTAARFRVAMQSIVAAKNDVFYVVDQSVVRRVTLDGTITTIAGKAEIDALTDGAEGTSRLATWELRIAHDPSSGKLYVADKYRVRMIVQDPPLALTAPTISEAAVLGSDVGTLSQPEHIPTMADPLFNGSRSFLKVSCFPDVLSVGTDGRVYVTGALDYERFPAILLTASCSGPFPVTSQTLNATIADADDQPTAIAFVPSRRLARNTPPGTDLGTLQTTDANSALHTYSQSRATNATMVEVLTSGVVRTTDAIVGTTNATASFSAIAIDEVGQQLERSFDVEIHAPATSLSLSNAAVQENSVVGTLVGVVSIVGGNTLDETVTGGPRGPRRCTT